MKVLNVTAHNVLRIKDIDLKLDGHHLFLVGGKNDQGKTSALMAITMALCGRSGMENHPEVALQDGADEGFVKVALSGDKELHDEKGFVAELRLVRKRTGVVAEEFRLLDSAGDEAPEPRKTLQRLFSLKSFDPLAFERLDAKSQRKTVLGLLGIDTTEFDRRFKEAFEERAAINRDGVRHKAHLESLLAEEPEYPGVTAVSMTELLEQSEKIVEQNKHRQEFERQAQKWRTAVTDYDAKISSIDEDIKKLEARKAKLIEDNENTKVTLAEVEAKLAAHPGYADPSDVIAAITEAETTNRKARHNATIAERRKVLDDLRAKSQTLSDSLSQIESEKVKAIREAKWPVPGMELREDGLLLDGLPFEQASKSKRVLASVKIGMALNPKLRLLVCQDGGDLDEDAMDALQEMLEANDFQMIVELVTRTAEDEDRCCVIIKDGVEHVRRKASPRTKATSRTEDVSGGSLHGGE